MGVQMFHIHARDHDQEHTSDPECYGRIIEKIRDLPNGKEVIVCVTTSGRNKNDFITRSGVLDLDGKMKPDMASLTLSSLNFSQSASVNTPETIRLLAKKMLEKKIKPELEVFDLGMANFIRVLAKESLIQGPFYVNVILGNIFSAQFSLSEISALKNAIPEKSVICVGGIGRDQLRSNIAGLCHFNGVRLGVEDNLWLDKSRKRLARNIDFVNRLMGIAREMELTLIDRPSLRLELGLN
jgi:uncharacterized protein (DUF849 family)